MTLRPPPRLERLQGSFERGLCSGLTGEMVRFGFVGGTGFLADVSVLTLLVSVFGWDLYTARLLQPF